MTDARQEDQDRMGQPIVANRVGHCAVRPPACRDRILVGDEIVCVGGSWVHVDCQDAMEAQLAETDSPAADDRPWRACVPGTILADGLTQQEALERAARAEANRPDDAYGHAFVEQYDEPKVCPTCGVVEGTGEVL